MQLTPFGFIVKKKVNVLKAIKDLAKVCDNDQKKTYLEKLVNRLEGKENKYHTIDDFFELVTKFVVVNNKGDVCVKLDLKKNPKGADDQKDETVYIYEHRDFVAAENDHND